jgi:hypothetical protein
MAINNLNYFNGTADLQLEVPDANLLEQIRTALIGKGYAVQVQTVPGSNGGVVSARMRLSREGEAS